MISALRNCLCLYTIRSGLEQIVPAPMRLASNARCKAGMSTKSEVRLEVSKLDPEAISG